MRTTRPLLALASAVALLAGCGSESDRTASDDVESAAIVDTVEEDLSLVDGWAKATEESMTGVFGTLVNGSEQDIHLAGVESDLAGLAELQSSTKDGLLTLVDDPTNPDSLGAEPYDDEGLATRRVPLLHAGVVDRDVGRELGVIG